MKLSLSGFAAARLQAASIKFTLLYEAPESFASQPLPTGLISIRVTGGG